jgi:ribosomal protein L7/L12
LKVVCQFKLRAAVAAAVPVAPPWRHTCNPYRYGFLAMPMQPLPEDVRQALDAGRKLDAIRLLRVHTGLGLAAAKAAVEANGLPVRPDVSSVHFGNAEPLPPAARAALDAGQKIEAIRLLRQARGISLKEAKTIVDAAMRERPALPGRSPGQVENSPLNAALWVALAVVLGLVVWRLLGWG